MYINVQVWQRDGAAGANFVDGLETEGGLVVIDAACPDGICLWILGDEDGDGRISEEEAKPFAPGGPAGVPAGDPVAIAGTF